MALFKFVENILGGRPIDIYNFGRMERDFTYIDDLVEAIARLAEKTPVVGHRSLRRIRSAQSRPSGSSISAAAGRSIC
jgi:nucleoside-diphosphate-sugar epimerase